MLRKYTYTKRQHTHTVKLMKRVKFSLKCSVRKTSSTRSRHNQRHVIESGGGSGSKAVTAAETWRAHTHTETR